MGFWPHMGSLQRTGSLQRRGFSQRTDWQRPGRTVLRLNSRQRGPTARLLPELLPVSRQTIEAMI
jgi:hypothetical protein